MRVTVISTVLNEGEAIRRLLDSLLAQTRRPDEVVIVDGGSRDNTVAVIQEYAARLPLRVLVEPGANISRGRNVAIAAATGDVIASVDAGVWLETQWLERLVAPLNSANGKRTANHECGASAGNPASSFQLSIRIRRRRLLRPRRPHHFRDRDGRDRAADSGEIKPESFLPSSRSVAFTKEAWDAAGGYPEWIDYCEDLIFDFRLRDVAGPFAWAPEAVAHFRPRGSLKAFFKQYYRYARGDGKADLWRKKHLIRYVTYLIALPGLLALSLLHSPGWWFVLLAGVMFYCATPYRRLHPQLAELAPLEQAKAVC